MRATLLTSVAAAALSLGVAAAMAQSGGAPGQSEPAPGRNRAPAAAAQPGPAPSQGIPGGKSDALTAAPDRSKAAPGEARGDASPAAPDRTGSAPGRDKAESATTAPARPGAATRRSAEDEAPVRSRGAASNDERRDRRMSSDEERSETRSAEERTERRAAEDRKERRSAEDRKEKRSTSGKDPVGSRTVGQSPDRRPGAVDEDAEVGSAGPGSAPGGRKSTTMQRGRSGGPEGSEADPSGKTGSAASGASAPGKNRGTEVTGGISEKVELNTEEKRKVTREFVRRDVRPVTNVNFSISIGERIPERVRVHEVPRSVVEIVPQYRGYRYVVVQDEIVILEPGTRRIVDVIERDATSSSRTSRTTRTSGSLSLTQEQRASISRTLRSDDARILQAGARVPQCLELRPMPRSVDVPELRDYRYLVLGDEIVLVEPETRRVVEIIQ